MSCGVAYRHGSALVLLWHSRLAAAAPILPLAWERPYSAGAALKKKDTHTQKLGVIVYHQDVRFFLCTRMFQLNKTVLY